MQDRTYRAMVVEEDESGKFRRSLKKLELQPLDPEEVLVRVQWSSLNYKDALSATGNRGVTRNYPHVPGIDCSGVVEKSRSDSFAPGDQVIVTSYDLGMNTPGGFSEYVKVPAAWVVPLPSGLSLKEAMAFGTAGFTAGMSVAALTHCMAPERGEVLVTGATGGVGCLSVAILAKLGYSVVAASGKSDADAFLKDLGAARVVSREEVLKGKERPLLKTTWAGVVDTVGGEILATAIKATDLGGVVTSCGNVPSAELVLNVYPFILRGVSLVGIDSQNCPMVRRRKIWESLAEEWKPPRLLELSRVVQLDELDREIDLILQGGQSGRVVVKI